MFDDSLVYAAIRVIRHDEKMCYAMSSNKLNLELNLDPKK